MGDINVLICKQILNQVFRIFQVELEFFRQQVDSYPYELVVRFNVISDTNYVYDWFFYLFLYNIFSMD